MNSLKELKSFIEKEYMRSLIDDIDAMELSPDEKVVMFADMCDQAGIDIRSHLLS